MKTVAELIGVQNDPVVEEVRTIISNGIGKMEQRSAQRDPYPPLEMRRDEWELAQEIVDTVVRQLNKLPRQPR